MKTYDIEPTEAQINKLRALGWTGKAPLTRNLASYRISELLRAREELEKSLQLSMFTEE